MESESSRQRCQKSLCGVPSLGLNLDVRLMRFGDAFLSHMTEPMQRSFEAMDSLEGGSISHPDEQRMVGLYGLQSPDRTPADFIRSPSLSMRKIRWKSISCCWNNWPPTEESVGPRQEPSLLTQYAR